MPGGFGKLLGAGHALSVSVGHNNLLGGAPPGWKVRCVGEAPLLPCAPFVWRKKRLQAM